MWESMLLQTLHVLVDSDLHKIMMLQIFPSISDGLTNRLSIHQLTSAQKFALICKMTTYLADQPQRVRRRTH